MWRNDPRPPWYLRCPLVPYSLPTSRIISISWGTRHLVSSGRKFRRRSSKLSKKGRRTSNRKCKSSRNSSTQKIRQITTSSGRRSYSWGSETLFGSKRRLILMVGRQIVIATWTACRTSSTRRWRGEMVIRRTSLVCCSSIPCRKSPGCKAWINYANCTGIDVTYVLV